MYPARSRVRRKNLVLRHSFPHSVADLNAALCPDTRTKNEIEPVALTVGESGMVSVSTKFPLPCCVRDTA